MLGLLAALGFGRPLWAGDHPEPVGTAADCGSCHEDIWEAWRGSRHAASFANRGFQVALQQTRQRSWCLECHLPRVEQRELLQMVGISGAAGTLLEDGVDCHSCHVSDGQLRSARAPSVEARAVHGVDAFPELADSVFCARCHQFAGPLEHHPARVGGDPLQDTFGEWERTRSEQTCQSCHMPAGQHGFAGGHDLELVRRALDISVERREQAVFVSLQTTEAVAHKVPTGDPFRRLRISLCADVACDQRLWVRYLGVAHEYRDGVLRVTADSRLLPGIPWTARVAPSGDHHFWEVALMYAEVHLVSELPLAEQRGIIASGPVEGPVGR